MNNLNDLLDAIYREIKKTDYESNNKLEYVICNLGVALNTGDYEMIFDLIKPVIDNKDF